MIKKRFVIGTAGIIIFCLLSGACGTEEDGSSSEMSALSVETEENEIPMDKESSAVSADSEDLMIKTDAGEIEAASAAEYEPDPQEENVDYASLSTNETITIYDIEDGYMEVPYYRELPQCRYDWDHLRLDGQRLIYDDPAYDTVLGIDVSKFQGDIDWDKVSKQGFDFVIIRLGYRGYENGKIVTDERFEENIKGAEAAGLEAGVYFLSQALDETEAVEEAEYTLSELERCSTGRISLPIVIDSERIKTGVSRTASMNSSELTDTVIAYREAIEAAGYKCALYANSQWLTKNLDIRRLADMDVWYADYQIVDNDETPLYPYTFSIWQYTNKGMVDGIKGDVDLNIYFREIKNGQ